MFKSRKWAKPLWLTNFKPFLGLFHMNGRCSHVGENLGLAWEGYKKRIDSHQWVWIFSFEGSFRCSYSILGVYLGEMGDLRIFFFFSCFRFFFTLLLLLRVFSCRQFVFFKGLLTFFIIIEFLQDQF